MEPVQAKFKEIIGDINKKICQFEYMKYMKTIGFVAMKCFKSQKEPGGVVGVKPY